MLTLTVESLIFRVVAMVLLVGINGFTVAAFARVLGDRGPGYDGRVTANPFRHVDGLGALALVFIRAGWSKPVAVDPAELKGGRVGLVVVWLGSLVVTALAIYLLLRLRPLVLSTITEPEIARTGIAILETLAELGSGLLLLNLLPLPPLTGGLLLQAVAPALFARLVSRQLLIALPLAVLLAAVSLITPNPLDDAIRAVAAVFVGGA